MGFTLLVGGVYWCSWGGIFVFVIKDYKIFVDSV